MMEISKGLRKEIMLVQNKLKNAIRDHQICMGKLKDNSNNADILGQIEEIRLHIISLGRCQKQVVQRLRKEVESFKAENVNGAKLSVASLLGLNNNNNINNNNSNNNNNNNKTNNNNTTNNIRSKNNAHVAVDEKDEQEDIVQVKVKHNGVFDNRRLSKENYEEVVRNGIDAASQEKICAKERSKSVEFLPAEEDVIEVSDDENTCENHNDIGRLEGIEEAPSSEQSKLNSKQAIFLGNLALITASKFSELQNKRAERKRRSTANPQFVYSNWDIPTKRKRHAYLQSVGNAPQTRQTTARLNGPSPPPSKISSSKSTSPSTKPSSSKSLMLIQKSTTVRPNILRNIPESGELSNKTKLENGISDMPISDSKSSQAKTMNIPGLPSSLTIERIESDTAVCIYCRNPGTLTYCDDCSISYHASCRSSSPPPVRLCSKCVRNQKDDERTQTPVIKKDEEIAPASSTPGVVDKAGKDTEVNKTSGGFYQINPTPSSQFITTANYGVNQLPISTYFIPISSCNVTNSTVSHPTDQQSNSANDTNTTNSIDVKHISDTCINNITYSPLIINQQHDNSGQLPVTNDIQTTEKPQQSFLVIKKISDPSVGGIVSYQQQHSNQQPQLDYSFGKQQYPTINYKLPIFESREGQNDFISAPSLIHDQLTNIYTESTIRNSKKSTTRTIPGLKPIASTEKSSANSNDNSSDRRILELSSTATTTNMRNGCRESKVIGAIGYQSIDRTDSQCSQFKKSTTNKLEPNASINQSNYRTKSGNLLNALLSSNYKSHNIINRNAKSSRENFNNLPPGSIADRLYRRLSKDQSCMRGTGKSTAQFNEYVKLEEAHLSAPSSTNLVQYKLIDKNDKDLILSRSKSCPVIDIMTYEKRDIPRILMRNGRRSLDSLKISREINVSENHDKIVAKPFHHVELKDEISSNKSDRMDVNIHEDTLTATEGECDDDNEDDDEATDSPDDIEYDKIASNIDMQVLEAFESAMMKEVNRDDTAN